MSNLRKKETRKSRRSIYGPVLYNQSWAGASMSKTALLAFTIVASAGVMFAADESTKHSAKPPAGFVPDAKTAIKIAAAVWEPIYGEKEIAREKPYTARLQTNGIWVVEGSFHAGWLNTA